MSEHRAVIRWQNAGETMNFEEFSRDHIWAFKGGKLKIPASAAPEYRGNPATADPEDALVAAISSCHMLTFLAMAAKKRLVVQSYADEAVGVLGKNAEGKIALTRVTLRPVVGFGPGVSLTDDEYRRLHERAHAECFIANSVRTEISCEPALASTTPG